MIYKYVISLASKVFLAFKFNLTKGEAVIGGHGSMLPDIQYIVLQYFGVSNGKEVWTQKNKVRITFKCNEKQII